MQIFNSLLECIFPTLCSGCAMLIGKDLIFCASCMNLLKPVPSIFFTINKNITLKIYAVSAYDGPVKQLVLKKFSHSILASHQLASLMLDFTPIRTSHFDYVVPVPLHWTRYAMRGYNQAYEAAKVLSNRLEIPVKNLVSRVHRTVYQSTLDSNARKDNVTGVFAINWMYRMRTKEQIQGKDILLIDDLCTTGSTIINVAKVLAQYNPNSITGLVGCRAI